MAARVAVQAATATIGLVRSAVLPALTAWASIPVVCTPRTSTTGTTDSPYAAWLVASSQRRSLFSCS